MGASWRLPIIGAILLHLLLAVVLGLGFNPSPVKPSVQPQREQPLIEAVAIDEQQVLAEMERRLQLEQQAEAERQRLAQEAEQAKQARIREEGALKDLQRKAAQELKQKRRAEAKAEEERKRQAEQEQQRLEQRRQEQQLARAGLEDEEEA